MSEAITAIRRIGCTGVDKNSEKHSHSGFVWFYFESWSYWVSQAHLELLL